jgi:hypothetical protein
MTSAAHLERYRQRVFLDLANPVIIELLLAAIEYLDVGLKSGGVCADRGETYSPYFATNVAVQSAVGRGDG